MINEPISEIMTTDLITAAPDQSLKVAYDLMRSKRIHHIPIVEGKKLVGIITTYDMFKLDMAPSAFDQHLLRDHMTPSIATLTPEDKISSAILLFVEHLFHAVPITDEEKNLVGIVSTLDVMKFNLRREYPDRFLEWGQ